MAHYIGKFDETNLQPAYQAHSHSYTQTALIDHTVGSVHTGTHMCQLAPQGYLNPHFHAFEESFYILQGEAVLTIDEQSYHLKPGDLGAVKVGQVHAWANVGAEPVRWFQMAAPQPKPAGGEWPDTYFLKDGVASTAGEPLDLNDTHGNVLDHFDVGQIPPPGDPARSTTSATPDVFLKWIMDENIGAIHHRLLFIEYQPGVSLGTHDHTFEVYLILSGQVEAIIEGERYLANPGDVLWTSVGCFHSFANIGSEPVHWLETFAPQPPREDVFRFKGAWEQRAAELDATG